MTKKLTINFHFTYPNMAGGTKSCRLLAEEMQRQGADVVIYHPDDPRHYKRGWARKFVDFIQEVLKKQSSGSINRDSQMSHHLEICEVPVVACPGNKIKQKYVRKADFDIANFWQQRAWMYSWKGSDFIPGLYVRGHAAGGETNLAEAYSSNGVTITHAKWLQKMLVDKYKSKTVILAPNGVDREQFKYIAREKNKHLTIGFQYSTDPRKGAETMFNAYEELLKQNPNIRLISYGSSEASEQHKARFPDWEHLYRPDYNVLAGLYHQTDCWVLPSTSEGLPMPPLEAAASGTPVVATDCGGPEDYVTEGESGFIVPIGDHAAMAEAIGKVIFSSDEEWKKMSSNSYKNTLAFDWSKSASHLIKELIKYRDSEK
jgi:glycosyltransferase involved in cell wall biosynthesis